MPSSLGNSDQSLNFGKAETQRLSQPQYAVSVYDILQESKLTKTQVAIMLYGFLSYVQLMNHVLLPSLTQQSLWEHWPELEEHHIIYNSVLAGQAVARLFGNLYITPLMDYYGRKNLFLLCNVLPVLLTFGSMFAPSFAIYAVFRCLTIFIATASGGAANVYVMEIVNPKYRAMINSLQQAFCCLGLAYMVGCKYLLERSKIRVWDWLQLWMMAPTVLGIAIGLVTRLEPPGFQILFQKNGANKAWVTIEKIVGGPVELDRILDEIPLCKIRELQGTCHENIASGSTIPPELSASEIELAHSENLMGTSALHEANAPMLSRDNVLFTEEALASVDRNSLWTFIDIRPIIFGWSQLFKRMETRWDTIGLCVIWFEEAWCYWAIMSYCTVFYDIVGYDPNVMTIIVWTVQIPLHIVMLKIMIWARNERLIIGINSVVSVCLSLSLGILLSLRQAKLLQGPDIILAFLSVMIAIVLSIVWGPLLAYSAQRYPIKVRASAVGLFYGVDSIAVVASTYMGSVIMAPGSAQYILYANAALSAFSAFVTLCVIKTDVSNKILDFDD